MKKILVLFLAIAFLATAGPAMAAFELGNFHLVAYVEADNNSIPVGTAGNEVHYDLGTGLFDVTGDIDTGITLAALGATSWDDIYVGIVGGGYTPTFGNDLAYFSSDTDDFTASTSVYSQFQSASVMISSAVGPISEIQPKATGSWYASMLLSGSGAGTYAGMVNANDDFGAETQMNGGLVDAAMYSFDGAGSGAISEVLAFQFDTSGSTIVLAEAAPIPVPAAVWLLGSGLLGLVGIRRRKA